jgi:hypothetical protein
MYQEFQKAVIHLIRNPALFSGFRRQFDPQDHLPLSIPRNLNAAFLLVLSGSRLSHQARGYLDYMAEDGEWGSVASSYLMALENIEDEVEGTCSKDPWLKKALVDLAAHLDIGLDMSGSHAVELFHRVFCPEAVGLAVGLQNDEDDQSEARMEAVHALRERRIVTVNKLNPVPLTQPHREILFTSNALVTLPPDESCLMNLPAETREEVATVMETDQLHWYDHPIPLGVEGAKNEVLYGLFGLEEAVLFEITRGTAPPDTRLPVLLSVSTTHNGLGPIARDFLTRELDSAGDLEHLEVHMVTEGDARALLDHLFLPASKHYFPNRDVQPLLEVLGVDGEYGKHYSFLKAVSALWSVMVDPDVRGTFKVDLDQRFPQDVLVEETGQSAFEHLADPLWGAEGIDHDGDLLDMGLLAGALVNEKDIHKGLFTADVTWPADNGSGNPLPGEQWVFASALPQALSTDAEMMARYQRNEVGAVDGVNSCYQRVHVTGGTTGILVDALRRHRPFTPSWIGRAEDQAYIMSVLYSEQSPALRYLHASGLIMRHDKEAFAADAIEAAHTGKVVGDIVRVLAFTSYAKALPWGVPRIKSVLDPFTGSFISRLPLTVAWLRFALTGAGLFMADQGFQREQGSEMVRTGTARLASAWEQLGDPKAVRERLLRERAGWDLYYDLLDEFEKGLAESDPFARESRETARKLVEDWRLDRKSGR